MAKTKGGALAWVGDSGVLGAVPDPVVNWGRNLAREQGKELVAEVLGEMQARVPEVWDVKTQVVGAMCRDKKIIIELFQRCGREEFVFIRRSGLYFGFLFGIIQMAQWLVWDPWWSLAVGGALVGYATDWLALKLMFEPVEPVSVDLATTAVKAASLRRCFASESSPPSSSGARFSPRRIQRRCSRRYWSVRPGSRWPRLGKPTS